MNTLFLQPLLSKVNQVWLSAVTADSPAALEPLERPALLAANQRAARPSRLQIGAWAALLVVSIALWFALYPTFQVGVYQDDAAYVVLARSLAFGPQYGMINAPAQPGPAPFPFGYPLFLAPLVRLFPDNLDILKLPSLLATLVNAGLIFWGWRAFSKDKSYWWALLIAALYLFSPLIVDHTRMVMSEPVFTTFCLAGLILAEQGRKGAPGVGWSLALTVVLLLAFVTRSIGVVLGLAVVPYLLLVNGRRIWKRLALVAAQAALLIGAVLLFTPISAASFLPVRYLSAMGVYTSAQPIANPNAGTVQQYYFQAQLQALQDHLTYDIPELVFSLEGERADAFFENSKLTALPGLIRLSIVSLVALGLLWWFLRERLLSAQVFLVLYIGGVLLWFWSGPRLLYPIQPLLLFCFILGVEAMLSGLSRLAAGRAASTRAPWVLLAFVAVVMLSASLYRSAQLHDTRLHLGDLAARTAWLQTHSDSAAVVMTEQPEIDFLYGGRKTIPYSDPELSAAQFNDYLNQRNVAFVLVAPEISWRPVLHADMSEWSTQMLALLARPDVAERVRLVYSSPEQGVRVFQVQPRAAQ